MIPNYHEISQFIELFKTQHLSKTAVKLGITQPTLSQSLQKLESKLGTQLFIRTKQGLLPTQAAQIFYSKSQELIVKWSELDLGLNQNQNEVRGQFRIGCHVSVGSYTLPKLYHALDLSAPMIQLDLELDYSRIICEQVISYDLDLAYVVNPFKHPDLILKKLGEDQYTFWKSTLRNKLPERVFVGKSSQHVDQVLLPAKKKFFKNWEIVTCSSLELIRTLTLKGQGVGLMPARVAHSDDNNVRKSDLILYNSFAPSLKDEIYLVYRREILNTAAGRKLIELAKIKLD